VKEPDMPSISGHNFVKMKSNRKEDREITTANTEWLEEDAGANSFASRVKERTSARKYDSYSQYELVDNTGISM